ncbi:MAG TPA: hypothetical protein VEZ90_03430 [Blastocatellia bacterium]|nr:hypothetical protein [Blastocatellia bacterium]
MIKTRILIVDDRVLFREGLRALLSVFDNIEVAGEASNGEEAILQTRRLKPSVVTDGPANAHSGRSCDPQTAPGGSQFQGDSTHHVWR